MSTPLVRPRIAITPCNELKLPDYVESVRLAGGDPWVLDLSRDRPVDVIANAAGLVMTGGGDVHPARYGAAAHAKFDAAESGRDDFELELASRAHQAETPILAICRGVQVLNVARGGTLYQHLPDESPSTTAHEVRASMTAIAHEVAVVEGSLLSRLLQGQPSSVRVNSRHHQAPNLVGEGLVVTATAADGVIEALEDPSRDFCLGVQWHPENFWRTGEFHALFAGFVRAAQRK